LKENQAVFYDDTPIAYFYNKGQTIDFDAFDIISYTHNDLIRIAHTWDIFKHNADAIALDFALLTKGRTSQPISKSVHCVNKDQIFLEEGAEVSIASLNATDGPIYIGKNATIMEA